MTISCSLEKMHGSTLFRLKPSSSSFLAKKCCQSLGLCSIPYKALVGLHSTSELCSSSGGGWTSKDSAETIGACSEAELMVAVITSHLLIKLKVTRICKLMCDGGEAPDVLSGAKSCCLKLASTSLARRLSGPSLEDLSCMTHAG